jgi:hypothetical protein
LLAPMRRSSKSLMTAIGPSRHFVRRNDCVALGGKADLA